MSNVLTEFHQKKITDNHIHSCFLSKYCYKGETKQHTCYCPTVWYVLRPTEVSGIILITDTAFLVHLQISMHISSNQAPLENFHAFQVNAT